MWFLGGTGQVFDTIQADSAGRTAYISHHCQFDPINLFQPKTVVYSWGVFNK